MHRVPMRQEARTGPRCPCGPDTHKVVELNITPSRSLPSVAAHRPKHLASLTLVVVALAVALTGCVQAQAPARGSVGVRAAESNLTPMNADATGVIYLQGNQTLKDMHVRGHIYWRSDGGTMTVENSILEGGYGSWGMISGEGTGHLIIRDSTVRWRPGHTNPQNSANGSGAVHGANWRLTIERADISGLGDGVKVAQDNSSITDSWIHDLLIIQGFTHNDCIHVTGGTNLSFLRNRLECSATQNASNSAIFFSKMFPIGTAYVEGNYMDSSMPKGLRLTVTYLSLM